MKPLFTVFLLAFSLFIKAQNVYIPDSVFKHLLLRHDTNNDGELQIAEAEAITDLDLYAQPYRTPGQDHTGTEYWLNITDFTGLRSLTNLRRLSTDHYSPINIGLRTLDVSGMPSLRYLNCYGHNLQQINLSGCTGLDSLYILGDSAGFTPYNSTLRSLDLSGCPNLTVLSLSHFWELNTLNIAACTNLKKLALYGLWHTTVNTVGLHQLESVECTEGGFVNLDVSNCTTLKTVNLSPDTLIGVNVNGCINLESLSLEEYRSSSVDSIDLSSCVNLKSFYLNSVNLRYLNIKNGSSLNSSAIYAPNLAKVCADDFEVIPILNSIVAFGNTTVFVSPYCSFTLGGAYNTLKGKISLDENNNGCSNTNRTLEGVPVLVSNSANQRVVVNSGNTGNFSLFLNKGSFRVSPYTPFAYYNLNPLYSTAVFDTLNSLVSENNFCLRPNGTFNDLEISFLPSWQRARPGFKAGYTLTYKNRGTTVLSGDVQLNFDNNKMNFTSASENVSSQSNGQLVWNYNNLQPFESKTINVTFTLLPPPVNNNDDTLIYLAAITPSVNDATTFDNSFILPQRITGSFDPNDKQCFEGSKLDISKIGDYLHYQIRFQNEGTDTAFNVVIVDTLSDKLDWNTFEFMKASHPVEVKLTDNKAEFIFENIHLPYKAINEPASNGWVAFKIKPKPSVVIGDSLNNNAAIYFDFNLPVITNTATTVVTTSSTPLPVKMEYFSINKKENSNQLNWKASCTYGNAIFVIERGNDGIHFTGIGNIKADALRCQLPFNFIDNKPGEGKNYYRLKITDADGKSFYSKVLVTGNSKAGLEIKAVANNIVYLSSNKQQTIQIKVIAADGKEILNERKTIAAGSNNMSLQVKDTAKGIYTLIVYTEEGETITKRFIQ